MRHIPSENMTLQSSCVEYKQPHSKPGKMPEADMCFTFLGSRQSPPGVAEWHMLLSICKHCDKSSPGLLALLCTRVTCRVFEPADRHSSCILGSATLHVLGPARTILLPGRKQDFLAALIQSLLSGTSNLKTLHPPVSLWAARKHFSSFVSRDATELSIEVTGITLHLRGQYFPCSLHGAMCTTHWEQLVKKKIKCYFGLPVMFKIDVFTSIKCFDKNLPLEHWIINYMFYNFFFLIAVKNISL